MLLIGLGLAAVAAAGCGSGSSESGSTTGGKASSGPVKVAGLFAQSGPNVGIEEPFKQALELAAAQNPGVIDVKYYDTGSDPAIAVQRYQEATTRDGQKLIFGAIFTPVALAISERVQNQDVLMFTPGSAAPALTDPVKANVFTMTPTTALLVGGMTKLLKSMDATRLGVIYETDDYGESVRDAVKAGAAEAGLDVVTTKTIGVEAGSASAQIAAMRSANVDAVVLGAIAGPTSVILEEAQKQRLEAALINSIPGTIPALTEQAMKRPAPGFYASTPLACPIDPALVGDCAKTFSEQFKKRFGRQPGVYDAIGYVGALSFIDAVKRAKSSSPDDIAAALESGPGVQNELMPNVHWTAENHLGATTVNAQGIVEGKLSFFGTDINDNQLG